METIVAQSARSALSWISSKARRSAHLHSLREADFNLPGKATVTWAADRLGPGKVDAVEAFLSSTQFAAFACQMLIAHLHVGTPQHEELTAVLRSEIVHCLRHIGIPDDVRTHVADLIHTALMTACSSAWSEVGGPRALGLDASSIPSISRVVAAAALNDELLRDFHTSAEVNAKARIMRAQVAAMHDRIRLPHVGVSRSVPWDQLYVRPRLESLGDHAELVLGELVSPGQRTVILGDPGAGKSTLAAWLAYATAADPDDDRVPFLVVLRHHSAEIDRGGKQLSDYLASASAEPYNARLTVSEVDYLLLNGRAVVILDGLDELTDVALRGRIIGLVEGFAHRYPFVPVVVTSRRVGYGLPSQHGDSRNRSTAFDGQLFQTSTILSFNPEEVAQYASHWFRFDESLSEPERERLLAAFLRESASVSDLRSNPLLLALLCGTYASEQYIPRNRANVYERCALMVFDRWDAMRGIRMPMEFHGRVRGAVQHLAWQVLSSGGTTELPRGTVLSSIVNFLVDRRHDVFEAAQTAEDFLHFCAGRAWVLAEVGATETEPVYGFAHRTFLEYFAAEHLVRTQQEPEVIWDILRPRLLNGQWDIVGQLVLQLLDRNLDNGADRVLNCALKEAYDASLISTSAEMVAGFTARALGHVCPSPDTVERILGLAVERAADLPHESRLAYWISARATSDVHRAEGALYEILLDSLAGNLSLIGRELRRLLDFRDDRDRLRRLSEQSRMADLLASVFVHLAELHAPDDHDRSRLWRELSSQYSTSGVAGYSELRRRPDMLRHLTEEEIQEIISQRGPAAFYLFRLVARSSPIRPAAVVLSDRAFAADLRQASHLAAALMRIDGPWLPEAQWNQQYVSLGSGDTWQYVEASTETGGPVVGADLGTGLLLRLPYLETAAGDGRAGVAFGELGDALVATRRTSAITRSSMIAKLKAVMGAKRIPAGQRRFLMAWANREINVIGDAAR